MITMVMAGTRGERRCRTSGTWIGTKLLPTWLEIREEEEAKNAGIRRGAEEEAGMVEDKSGLHSDFKLISLFF